MSRSIKEKSRSIREIQQDFANNSGYQRNVIWDLLSAEQHDILKQKIRQLIPDQETGMSAIEEKREILFQNVWAQRKYTNNNSLTAIIYVLVTKEIDVDQAPDAQEFSCHPVFRTRKCINPNNSNSLDCCMVFIDETGRVYQRWEDFVCENEYPAGTMVAPKRGIYTFDDDGNVLLEACSTPASSTASQVLFVADTTTAVGGILSSCVPIAAILTVPVAAPVMAVAGAVGLTVAGYSTVRSIGNLIDRGRHDQPINITHRQARGSWLAVGAAFVGLGAAGATRAMSTVAAAGREISSGANLVVNGLNITSIVFSGTGVANGVLDMILKYRDDEEITPLEIVQQSASLVLFTHSVCNFRLASTIVQETRNGVVESYRRGLSKNQRRIFDKMAKETIRIQGDTRGKMDIIRSVNEIPSKQYLNDLYKINKNLNEQRIRPSFGGDGQPVILNGEVAVDTQTLRSSVQHNVGPDVLGQVKQPIPSSFNEINMSEQVQSGATNSNNGRSTKIGAPHVYSAKEMSSSEAFKLGSCRIVFPNGIYIDLFLFGKRVLERVVNEDSFRNVLLTIAQNFCEESVRFLMTLTRNFIENSLDDIERILQMFITSESVLYRIMLHCIKTYSEPTLQFLGSMERNIIEAVTKFFTSLNPNTSEATLATCKWCGI